MTIYYNQRVKEITKAYTSITRYELVNKNSDVYLTENDVKDLGIVFYVGDFYHIETENGVFILHCIYNDEDFICSHDDRLIKFEYIKW